jgi:hypothetical protein
MLDCRHATQLASRAMEERLPLRQRIALRFHLLLCDACTNFVRQLKLLRAALTHMRHAAENSPGVELSQQARERIAAAMAMQASRIDEARRNPDQHSTD